MSHPGQRAPGAALDPLHLAEVIAQSLPWSMRGEELGLHPPGRDVAF